LTANQQKMFITEQGWKIGLKKVARLLGSKKT